MNIVVLLDYPLQNQIDTGHLDVLKIQYENMLKLFDNVYVVSPRDDQKYNLGKRIKIISNGCSGRITKYFSPIKDLLLLLKLIKKNNIRLIRALAPSSGLVSVLAGKLTGTPTVLSLHTDRKISSKTNSENKLKQFFLNITEGWTYRNANLVLVVSKHIQERAKYLGVKNSRIHYNFVDTDLFKPLVHRNKTPVLIFVGRLVKVHGVDILIKTLPMILKKREVILKICGDGPERKNLEKIPKRLGVSKNIKFLGKVNHSDIPKEMGTADLFVSPSLSGFTLIEALACGLPIVAADIEWSREVVNNSVGKLVKYNDLEAFASAVNEILTNKKKYSSRKKAVDMFSLDSWKKRELEVYRNASRSK